MKFCGDDSEEEMELTHNDSATDAARAVTDSISMAGQPLSDFSVVVAAGGPIPESIDVEGLKLLLLETGIRAVQVMKKNEDAILVRASECDGLKSLLSTSCFSLRGTALRILRGWAAGELPLARVLAFCLFGSQFHSLTTPERLAASAHLRYGCRIRFIEVTFLPSDPISPIGIVFEATAAGATALHGRSWQIVGTGAACTVCFVRLDPADTDATFHQAVRQARQAALGAPQQPLAALPSAIVSVRSSGLGHFAPPGIKYGRPPPGGLATSGSIALRRAASGREERPGMIKHMAIFLDAENCQVHPKAGR